MKTQRQEIQLQVSVETLLRAYVDVAFWERRHRVGGAQDYKLLSFTNEGGQLTVSREVVEKADMPLPGFAKKVLANQMSLVVEDRWKLSARRGEACFRVKSAPIQINASMELHPVDSKRCRLTQTWQVEVRIPLVGGQIEAFVLSDVVAKAEREARTLCRVAAEYESVASGVSHAT